MVSAVQILSAAELNSLWAFLDNVNAHGPGALWLPAHPDNEESLVTDLSASWGSFEWLALGTWYATKASSNAPNGFVDRYPGMVREAVAETDMKTVRGLRVRAEWCTINCDSQKIKDFLASVRKARGKGMCLALLPAGTSPRNWYAFSMEMLGRAMLAVETGADVQLEEMHKSATWRYLVECSRMGYACVIPLDYHPWGGCAVVAAENQLADLARQLPKGMGGLAQVAWEEVARGGGGLAL